MVLQQWASLKQQTSPEREKIAIDGHSLDIATVVAVARHGAAADLHERTFRGIAEGAKLLQLSLNQGDIIYGVNTGFGGSADTRTMKLEELQTTLIRELHCGILINSDAKLGSEILPLEDGFSNTCMPESWVRASILIRINSLASGHSGVRPILINSMLELLKNDITPRIPLRGSISASGDLVPLAYVGGALEGKRGTMVWVGRKAERRVVTADVALETSHLKPLRLGPKEGLALINGTAVSCGVAALAMYEVNNMAVLSQVLAAMSVEALCGTDESFDPFFAAVRPHQGQTEVGRNIHSFLDRSKLVRRNHGLEEGSLRQDRYSIRTASQWLGPVLEDLVLATTQLSIECNSVTDNPLIEFDFENPGRTRTHHGGNFQAKAVTSAMEKVRLGVQTIGQMLFAQCTEIINPKLNHGLPPNLVVDEPSESWLMKSVDIMMASLQSELGFLSNPAGTHVLSAEMGNQSLNSLGLISARYTHIALEVLSQLASAHLFVLCQALDLRAMQLDFLKAMEPVLIKNTSEILSEMLSDDKELEVFHASLWKQFRTQLDITTTLDSTQRFSTIFKALQPTVLDFASSSSNTVFTVKKWSAACSMQAQEIFLRNRELYHSQPDASDVLGKAASRLYKFVRDELKVPFLRTTMLQDQDLGTTPSQLECTDKQKPRPGMTTGSLITIIYNSIRDGSLYMPVLECLAEVKVSG
ncbi:hypothetical protein MMC17_001496 [Xylographa soralifera]|nr:hypothetical protein [Xylographa soralifera]